MHTHQEGQGQRTLRSNCHTCMSRRCEEYHCIHLLNSNKRNLQVFFTVKKLEVLQDVTKKPFNRNGINAKEGKIATYLACAFPVFQDKVHLIKLISHPCYKCSVK